MPIQLGDGSQLSAAGVKPDIVVRVEPEQERTYFADPFRNYRDTNVLFASTSLSLTNTGSVTNRPRRPRFNEAELVRERREGPSLETDLAAFRESEPEKPVVRDPVLARALDLLKGLAVVRHSRS